MTGPKRQAQVPKEGEGRAAAWCRGCGRGRSETGRPFWARGTVTPSQRTCGTTEAPSLTLGSGSLSASQTAGWFSPVVPSAARPESSGRSASPVHSGAVGTALGWIVASFLHLRSTRDKAVHLPAPCTCVPHDTENAYCVKKKIAHSL